MKVLALEPYYGGSHRAFLDGWRSHSRHDWTVLGLPPFKWKWRMRHSAYTFAEQARERVAGGDEWDCVFCSDMLDLAAFRGLAPATVRNLPTVIYFHENQLTYPVRCESERDYHFGYTNMTTALAATRVWFNSAFNRDSFLEALPGFLKRMPDYQPVDAVERIRDKSEIQPPGVGEFPPRGERRPGPLRILWAARWEHDKNPELFFEALRILEQQGCDFRISVIGEQFRDVPAVFDQARQQFRARIDHWGYLPTRAEYEAALLDADVIVSTANHEFFGISVVEAIAAGALPILPWRLAYPEILADVRAEDWKQYFYDGSAKNLSARLAEHARMIHIQPSRGSDHLREIAERYAWPRRASEMDEAIQRQCSGRAPYRP